VIGYLSLGKTFAYLGIYPFFITELLACWGVCAFIIRGHVVLPRNAAFVLWTILAGGVAFQVVVQTLVEGGLTMETFRNIAPIYYGGFSVLAYAALREVKDRRLDEFVIGTLNGALPIMLAGNTLLVLGEQGVFGALPSFPGTHTSVLVYRPTDAVVSMALAFGISSRHRGLAFQTWACALLVIAAARNRSALICAIITLALWVRPTRRSAAMVLVLLVAGFALFQLELQMPIGQYREVSARQFVANFVSLYAPERGAQIDRSTEDTTRWRLRIWREIVTDAQERGFILSGLGWEVNLANHYRFQGSADPGAVDALRSPHNFVVGMIARGGFCVGALWAAVAVLTVYTVIRRKAVDPVSKEFKRVLLTVLLLCLVNSLTDVFMESPQNAVLFWIFSSLAWTTSRSWWREGVPQGAAVWFHSARKRRVVVELRPAMVQAHLSRLSGYSIESDG
jgi:hypothetical protein